VLIALFLSFNHFCVPMSLFRTQTRGHRAVRAQHRR
jgi:hypothetical protein